MVVIISKSYLGQQFWKNINITCILLPRNITYQLFSSIHLRMQTRVFADVPSNFRHTCSNFMFPRSLLAHSNAMALTVFHSMGRQVCTTMQRKSVNIELLFPSISSSYINELRSDATRYFYSKKSNSTLTGHKYVVRCRRATLLSASTLHILLLVQCCYYMSSQLLSFLGTMLNMPNKQLFVLFLQCSSDQA